MGLIDWIPPVTVTAIFGFVLYLLRTVISTRLTKSVQHEYDKKLEEFKSDFRKKEESFKIDLKAKELQIEGLRNIALSGLSSRQAVLDKRRIEAVEQLWSDVQKLRSYTGLTAMLANLKFDATAKVAAENQKFRDFFADIVKPFDIKTLKCENAGKAQPFISEISWAFFQAYQAIISVALIKINILILGVEIPDTINKEALEKCVKIALPHQSENISKFDTGAYHYFLEEIERRLLTELQKTLSGQESDKETIKQAATIINLSKQLMDSISGTTKNQSS